MLRARSGGRILRKTRSGHVQRLPRIARGARRTRIDAARRRETIRRFRPARRSRAPARKGICAPIRANDAPSIRETSHRTT